MANQGMLPEGHSIHRPPYFDGYNYGYWKNRMTVFLRAQSYEIWKVVSKGPYALPENEDIWTEMDIKKCTMNFNALNILQCAIHPNEYSRVSMCSSAKDMWDKLRLIYEGTSEVKETKANLLVREYELFQMKPEENISEMLSRLMEITNGLKSLGKEYTSSELVRKVLRSLTPAWHTKATVIEDSKDLSMLTLDELIGSLMTYEINIKRSNEEDPKKSKSIALKANPQSSSSSSEDDEMNKLTKAMKKFLQAGKKHQWKHKKSHKKNSMSKGEKGKLNEITCFECRKPGHMRGDCPEYIKKMKKGKSKNSKAMMATWSNSEDEEDEKNEELEDLDELRQSMCLMAHEEGEPSKVNSDPEPISSEEWELGYAALYSKYKKTKSENKALKKKIEYLAHDYSLTENHDELKKCCEELKSENQNLLNEIDAHMLSEVKLREYNENLKNENMSLTEQLARSNEKIGMHEYKISDLKHEIHDLQIVLSKFVKGKENLNQLLGMKVNFQKEGLGYTPQKGKAIQMKNTTFVQACSDKSPRFQKQPAAQYPRFERHSLRSKKYHSITRNKSENQARPKCFYCQKVGHIVSNCLIKMNASHLNLVWIKKDVLRELTNLHGPKLVWVPKSG